MTVTIQVFCKAPVPGTVKTRLQLPPEESARFHEAMANRVLAGVVALPDVDRELWCHPDTTHPFFQSWQTRMRLCAQQGADLGERMCHAMTSALTAGGNNRVILIGTDCPDMSSNYLAFALSELDHADAVIAPAEDGGYGLIGLRRVDPGIFADIEWGTDTVYSETVARFNRYGLSYGVLPTLWDVDRPEDYARWQNNQQQD